MVFNRIIEIDFVRCFKALGKNAAWILLITAFSFVAGVLAAVILVYAEDVYDARASVYSIAYGSYTESAEGTEAIKTYSKIVESLRVAERAALLLGDDSLDKFAIQNMIEVESNINATATYVYEEDSAIINIHAKSTSPEQAVRVVNAVAAAYVLEVTSITQSGSVQVLDEAYASQCVYNAFRQQLMYIAVITLAGFGAACAFFMLSVIFTTRVHTIKEGSLYGELEIIGVIPEYDATGR